MSHNSFITNRCSTSIYIILVIAVAVVVIKTTTTKKYASVNIINSNQRWVVVPAVVHSVLTTEYLAVRSYYMGQVQ